MIDRKKLVKIREEKGYTQYELAKVAGISVVTLNKIETSDEAKPFNNTLKKIAAALGIEVEDLREQEKDISQDVFVALNSAMKERNKLILI